MFENTWNRIIDWFNDRSERNGLIRSFNESAKAAFISGVAPTLLKVSVSKGDPRYKHQFSAWMNTGFRIQALSGRALSKDEMVFLGNVVLNNDELVRKMIALGWDTLEVHDDTGSYGCKWKLTDYVQLNLALN